VCVCVCVCVCVKLTTRYPPCTTNQGRSYEKNQTWLGKTLYVWISFLGKRSLRRSSMNEPIPLPVPPAILWQSTKPWGKKQVEREKRKKRGAEMCTNSREHRKGSFVVSGIPSVLTAISYEAWNEQNKKWKMGNGQSENTHLQTITAICFTINHIKDFFDDFLSLWIACYM
jgi:hypothetical protein